MYLLVLNQKIKPNEIFFTSLDFTYSTDFLLL